MRKGDFCICENKDAYHSQADQGLCFRYTDSTISLLPKSEILKPLTILTSTKNAPVTFDMPYCKDNHL